MRKDIKKLKIRQLSNAIKKKKPIPTSELGRFLKNIRETIGMTQKQMAKILKVNQSVISRIEEKIESCTLKTILKVARSMGCELMGIITIKGSLEDMIRERAEKVAKKIMSRTYANMALEKQSPDNDAYKFQLNNKIEELSSNPGPILWEEQ